MLQLKNYINIRKINSTTSTHFVQCMTHKRCWRYSNQMRKSTHAGICFDLMGSNSLSLMVQRLLFFLKPTFKVPSHSLTHPPDGLTLIMEYRFLQKWKRVRKCIWVRWNSRVYPPGSVWACVTVGVGWVVAKWILRQFPTGQLTESESPTWVMFTKAAC